MNDKTKGNGTDKPITAVGSFDISRQMPNQSSFQIHGYIFDADFNGSGARDLNARVDMLMRVAERQLLISGLEMLDAQERKINAEISGLSDHVAGLQDMAKNAVKLDQGQKTRIKTFDATVDGYKKGLDQIARDRAELKQKISAMSV